MSTVVRRWMLKVRIDLPEDVIRWQKISQNMYEFYEYLIGDFCHANIDWRCGRDTLHWHDIEIITVNGHVNSKESNSIVRNLLYSILHEYWPSVNVYWLQRSFAIVSVKLKWVQLTLYLFILVSAETEWAREEERARNKSGYEKFNKEIKDDIFESKMNRQSC